MIYLSLLFSLLLTLLLEVPLARWRAIPLSVAIGANVLTNPPVVLLYHWSKHLGIYSVGLVILLELLAVLIEGYFYRPYHKHPYILSLLLNGFSFSWGLFLG